MMEIILESAGIHLLLGDIFDCTGLKVWHFSRNRRMPLTLSGSNPKRTVIHSFVLI